MFTAIKSGFITVGRNIVPGIGIGIGASLGIAVLGYASNVLNRGTSSLKSGLENRKVKREIKVETSTERGSATA